MPREQLESEREREKERVMGTILVGKVFISVKVSIATQNKNLIWF